MTERTPGPVEVNEIETRIDGIGHVTTYALVDAKGRSIVDALNATASEIRSEYDEVDGTASHWDGEAEANLEFIAEAWNSHDTLLSDNKRLTDEIEQARAYATRLAVSVGARCFPEVPEWRPLPDLLGVLTQLDNMTCGMARAALSPVATGRDPIADEKAAKFRLGDRVEKSSGSSWRGVVVGTYSTALTPEGYAVESEREPGSVQIYPAKALRLTTGRDPIADAVAKENEGE